MSDKEDCRSDGREHHCTPEAGHAPVTQHKPRQGHRDSRGHNVRHDVVQLFPGAPDPLKNGCSGAGQMMDVLLYGKNGHEIGTGRIRCSEPNGQEQPRGGSK